jgi:hypothetical protein
MPLMLARPGVGFAAAAEVERQKSGAISASMVVVLVMVSSLIPRTTIGAAANRHARMPNFGQDQGFGSGPMVKGGRR